MCPKGIPDISRDWSDPEVATRWLELYPPRDAKRQPIAPTQDMIQNLAENATWVQTARQRLTSLSWFMKCLKEPLSRMANKQDNCKGTFFEARFKSIAILDEEALLSVAAYIGSFLASTVERLREVADRVGRKWLVNVG
jgi:lysyl-tRNA synthetase class I